MDLLQMILLFWTIPILFNWFILPIIVERFLEWKDSKQQIRHGVEQ